MSDAIFGHRLDHVDYCLIDFETTGLSPFNDGIVEVACVRMSGTGQIRGGFSSLVKPPCRVGASQIHGIYAEDVADAPTIADISGHIARYLDGAVLVAYNVYFDYSFLQRQVLAPQGITQEIPHLCCMWMRGLLGLSPSRMKLGTACREKGIDVGTSHAAYDDAVASSQLFALYLRQARQSGLHTFKQLAGRKKYKFLKSWNEPLPRLIWSDLPAKQGKSRTTRYTSRSLPIEQSPPDEGRWLDPLSQNRPGSPHWR
ncbi:MAG: DNA polymerase III epsilon subunit family exonuclease [Kiritimatiellia bacterium]|jgi:DNA polymerase III epsilon subunit family exonuclease